MTSMVVEAAIILVLLIANGVFAMTEMALVSSRKSRLKTLADGGSGRARAALQLAEAPNQFLSTVQVGITLVGIFAGAFGGATLAEELSAALRRAGVAAAYSQPVAFGCVVALITYFSLVVGELAPKRLALSAPERVAMAMARPMRWLSRAATPAVVLLGASTDVLMRLLHVKPAAGAKVSEEEIRMLLHEGLHAGVFLPGESAMVERVLALDRLPVRQLMTPRAKIIWINVTDSHEAIWHKIVVSGHTVFPVFERTRDNIIGVVSVKAIYANLAAGVPVKVRDLMTPPLLAPATQPATTLLETFRGSGKHLAVVTNEYGGVAGLVSLHDILEAIVGDFPSQTERLKPRAMQRPDGSWLVDGMLDATEFERQLPSFRLPPPAQRDYTTFGGFIIKHLGRIPTEGDCFQLHGFNVEVIDMDGHRVDKILLMPLTKK